MSPVIRNRVLLVLAVFLTALAVVLITNQKRQLVAAVQDVRLEAEQLQFEHDKLRLERSAWGGHSRIERVARTELSMRPPRENDVLVLDLKGLRGEQLALESAQ